MKKLLLALVLLAACRTAPPMRISLVALSAPDADASAKWYVETLGFRQVSRNVYPDYGMTIAIVERDELRLEIVQVKDSVAPKTVMPAYANPASIHGFGKIAFRVNDLAKWEADLRRRGVKFQLEPMTNEADRTRSFIVLDRDGNWLQFTSPLPPSRQPV